MAQIIFYTKLGCATSTKQVDLLKQAGHAVEVRDLLQHPWTAEELSTYFGDLPVSERFNPNAPRVKNGEIDPSAYDHDSAIALMLVDRLLIRRPLMESEGKRLCGFDPVAVHTWVGLGATVYQQSLNEDFSSCSQPASTVQQCP